MPQKNSDHRPMTDSQYLDKALDFIVEQEESIDLEVVNIEEFINDFKKYMEEK